MKCFKYSIQQFENLTTFCRMIVWWWLVFVVAPGWAGESKSVPPQNNSVSTSCKQVDDNVVKKWKEEVQKSQESLTSVATRGGGELDISSPLFFSVRSSQKANFLAGTRKIHLAWEGGQKNYKVKVFPSGGPRNWIEESALLLPETKRLSTEEKEKKKEEKKEEKEFKEFKVGENYWVVVTDSNDNEGKWKFTVIDLDLKSQPFASLFEEIQKETSPDKATDQTKGQNSDEIKKTSPKKTSDQTINQKKWRLVAWMLSYGEKWKLEAYQQIAEQPREKKTDEFYWAWLGIKDGILPTCQKGAER